MVGKKNIKTTSSPSSRKGRSIEQRRYPIPVIAFVVAERTRGSTWKVIIEKVKEKFGTAPTERQMRTWWNRYGTDVNRSMKELVRNELMEIAQGVMANTVDATLWVYYPMQKRCMELGLPADKAFLFTVLLSMESLVQPENFDSLIQEYKEIRDQLREGVDTEALTRAFYPPRKKAEERSKQE